MSKEEYNTLGSDEKLFKDIIKLVVWIVGCYLVSLILNQTVIVNGQVPSSSMENTVMTGDRFIANRLEYTLSDPKRYDVVVFESPDEENKLLIKRIIGMPGDEVQIEEGHLYINQELTNEPYLKEEMYGSFGPYDIPSDSYLMLGDNRNVSIDARYWTNTYVTKNAILGEAKFTYFPKVKIIN